MPAAAVALVAQHLDWPAERDHRPLGDFAPDGDAPRHDRRRSGEQSRVDDGAGSRGGASARARRRGPPGGRAGQLAPACRSRPRGLRAPACPSASAGNVGGRVHDPHQQPGTAAPLRRRLPRARRADSFPPPQRPPRPARRPLHRFGRAGRAHQPHWRVGRTGCCDPGSRPPPRRLAPWRRLRHQRAVPAHHRNPRQDRALQGHPSQQAVRADRDPRRGADGHRRGAAHGDRARQARRHPRRQRHLWRGDPDPAGGAAGDRGALAVHAGGRTARPAHPPRGGLSYIRAPSSTRRTTMCWSPICASK